MILLTNGEICICGGGELSHSANVGLPTTKSLERLHEGLSEDATTNGMRGCVVQVSATWCATFSLYTNGSIVVVGEGSSGELGLGERVTRILSPALIKSFLPEDEDIAHIASGMAHTAAITSSGNVWAWGKGRKGQLGEPAEDVWEPRRIKGISFPVVRAVCGKDFTCVIGSHATGEVAVLGPNRNDRFGLREHAPKSVSQWKSIAASWGSVYILKQDGDIVAWGRDDHGQLPPAGLPPVEVIAAGSEHCLALTKTGKVLAWGWGEHGNCGKDTDQTGDVKPGWNEITVDGKVRAVFAGCATSFVDTTDDLESEPE